MLRANFACYLTIVCTQITKYRNRNGWTHRDVLRLAHPRPAKAPKLAASAPTKRKAQALPAAQPSEPAPQEAEVAGVAQATADLKLTDSPVTTTSIAPASATTTGPAEGSAAPPSGPAEKRRKVKGSSEDKVVAQGGATAQRVLAMRTVLAYAASDAVPESLAAQVMSQGAGRGESAEAPAGPQKMGEGEEGSAATAGSGGTASGEAVRVLEYLTAAERLRTGIKAVKPVPPAATPATPAEEGMAVEQAAPAAPAVESAVENAGEGAAKTQSKRQAKREAYLARKRGGRGGRGSGGARFVMQHRLRMVTSGTEAGSGGDEEGEVGAKGGAVLNEEAVQEAVALIKKWRFGHEHVGDQVGQSACEVQHSVHHQSPKRAWNVLAALVLFSDEAAYVSGTMLADIPTYFRFGDRQPITPVVSCLTPLLACLHTGPAQVPCRVGCIPRPAWKHAHDRSGALPRPHVCCGGA
jgi:hypothetical protein